MPDNSAKIEALEAIVNGAVTSITVDGVSTSLSIQQAQRRINELRRQDPETVNASLVRPVVTRIKLGGSW